MKSGNNINKFLDTIKLNSNNELIKRKCFLKILTKRMRGLNCDKLIGDIIKIDKENATAWMFYAEESWLKGDFRNYDKICKRAGSCSFATLYDKNARIRMLDLLKNIGLQDTETLRCIASFRSPPSEVSLFLRHADFLHSLAIIQDFYDFENKKNSRHLARKYLSLAVFGRPIGFKAELHVLQKKIFKQETAKNNLFTKESALLEKQSEMIIRQAVEVDNLINRGTDVKIKEFLSSPQIWWNNTDSYKNQFKSFPKKEDWLLFWDSFKKNSIRRIVQPSIGT